MVGVIDYGMGNLFSVHHALEMVGATVRICRRPSELDGVERIVLPGVGAFRDCIANLERKGFVDALERAVFEKGKPLFGICLGMQVLARKSFEGGEHKGLGWFEADVVRLGPGDPSLRVPQIGWNDVEYRSDSPLFNGEPSRPDFYFVHSYYMKCDDQNDVDAVCDYGGPVTAAVRKNNVFATQFHPEKSQDYGLKILGNFFKWNP
jgi:glutamine amidotransferase